KANDQWRPASDSSIRRQLALCHVSHRAPARPPAAVLPRKDSGQARGKLLQCAAKGATMTGKKPRETPKAGDNAKPPKTGKQQQTAVAQEEPLLAPQHSKGTAG